MIASERITLRGLRRSDLELLHLFNNTLEVAIASGGAPPTPQALERVLADHDSACTSGGRDGMRFAIEVTARAALIGQCALFDLDPVARTAELGIAIGDPSAWGQGYGAETVKLLLDYGLRHQNLRRVWLRVHADNERALRCYRRCGFVEEGRLRGHVWSSGAYRDVVLMGISPEPSGRPNTPSGRDPACSR